MRKRAIVVTIASIIVLTLVAWAILASPGIEQPHSHASHNPTIIDVIKLPRPTLKGNMSLEEALQKRRSVREYTGAEVSLSELSQLLWAAQGITSPQGLRTAPSAGALYPLEIYAVNATGVYHYDPLNHSLERIRSTNVQGDLASAAFNQNAVREAPLKLVITGVYERTAAKYGDRAERYVNLEAGHAAQNVLLECPSVGLGAVPIGTFDDSKVQDALGTPASDQPLYIIPIGRV